MNSDIQIVDVAPRDGFQAVKPLIEVERKAHVVRALADAGLERIETGAFVSPKAVPQMADTAALHRSLRDLDSVQLSALIANPRGASSALEAGVRDLVYVFSVSPAHNKANVNRSVDESIEGFGEVVSVLRGESRFHLRVNVATAFDCPFDGNVEFDAVIACLDKVTDLGVDVEFGLCDTTGRAFPDRVGALFERCMERFGAGGACDWAFHGHDTFGLGVANAIAAYQAGVRVFDSAAAGLGGCPFAPGATGNTATEDLVFTFENMGINTGIDLDKLLAAADGIAELPGASIGGHLRFVPRSRLHS